MYYYYAVFNYIPYKAMNSMRARAVSPACSIGSGMDAFLHILE